MKRASADDSADSRVKVGHRQAIYPLKTPPAQAARGFVLPALNIPLSTSALNMSSDLWEIRLGIGDAALTRYAHHARLARPQ